MENRLEVDDALIEKARRLGRHETKQAAVIATLDEYIARRKQVEVLKLFGTTDYDSTHDYKELRKLDRVNR